MSESRMTEASVSEAERKMIADAAHELRNICTVLWANLEMLQGRQIPGTQRMVERSLACVPRMDKVLATLSEIGRR